MALSSTVYNFDIDLSDSDRGVYESLNLRVARHPSESEDYLVARVVAYCLEYTEGIAFSKGLCDPDEPAIVVRDLTGAVKAWIEIGAPDAARLHKASKRSPRVAVYMHKDPTQWLRTLEGERIHRADALELYALGRGFVAALVTRLERRMAFGLSVAHGELLAALDDQTVSGTVKRCAP